MSLGNKPTFDPYSIGDFSVRDAIRSGLRSWRSHRLAFTGFACLSCFPSLVAAVMASKWLNVGCASVVLVSLIAIISQVVARTSRGLSSELGSSLRHFPSRLRVLGVVGGAISFIVAVPGLALMNFGLSYAYMGLGIGVVLGAPFVLAIPVAMVESLGANASLKRSWFLAKGRRLRVLPALVFAVFAAVLPSAMQIIHPSVAHYTLFVQPFFIILGSVSVGALYVNLYEH